MDMFKLGLNVAQVSRLWLTALWTSTMVMWISALAGCHKYQTQWKGECKHKQPGNIF